MTKTKEMVARRAENIAATRRRSYGGRNEEDENTTSPVGPDKGDISVCIIAMVSFVFCKEPEEQVRLSEPIVSRPIVPQMEKAG